MNNQQHRPFVARKFGPSHFERFDHLPVASLGYRDVGKVKVDCRFRLSKSLWGVLGHERTPAGIVYMDLTFDQPKGCRLASATVLVALEDPVEADRQHRHSSAFTTSSTALQVTDHYGPKQLRGEQKSMPVTKTYNFTPEINVLGNGAGGLGIDTAKTKIYTSRWSFTGQLLPGKDKRTKSRGTVYRTLKWELTENDLENQSVHNSVIHTGFAFEHDGKPFHMCVHIDGKLHRAKDRIKKKLKFPSERRKGDGSTVTLVDLGLAGPKGRQLDAIAERLPWQMEKENQIAIPVEIQDALPVSYSSIFGISNMQNHEYHQTHLEAIQSLGHSSQQAIKPGDSSSGSIENLAKALDPRRSQGRVIEGGRISEGSISMNGTMGQRAETNRLVLEKTRSPQSLQEGKDKLAGFSTLLLMVQLLIKLLDLFGATASFAEILNSRGEGGHLEKIARPNKSLLSKTVSAAGKHGFPSSNKTRSSGETRQ